MNLTYSYYKTGGATGSSNGITEFYFVKNSDTTWSQYVRYVGSNYHPPTQTLVYDFGAGTSLYTVLLNIPSESGAKVTFTYNITFN